jgi:hypothetical protein
MPAQAFQKALGRLINDQAYRTEIEANPNKLVDDFKLDQDEIGVLRQVWDKMSDHDVVGHDVYWLCCCCCLV